MRISRHRGKLKIVAGWSIGNSGIAIFGEPAIDMYIVGVGEADAGIKEKRKAGVFPGLRKRRPGKNQETNDQKPAQLHPLNVVKIVGSS